MLKWVAMLFLVAGLYACGSGDESFSCELGSLTGNYLVSFDELGGNCGPFPDLLVAFTPGQPSPECTLISKDVSEDRCHMDAKDTCTDVANDLVTTVTATWTQDNDSGTRLSGTQTIQATDLAGAAICTSTYRVTAVRQ
jgi:hypothetical protein